MSFNSKSKELNKLIPRQEIFDLACSIFTEKTFKSEIDDLFGIGRESRTRTNNLRRSRDQDAFDQEVLNTINIFLILIKLKIGIELSLRKNTIESTFVDSSS